MKNNHIRKLIILGLMSAYMSIQGASQLSRISHGLQSTIPSTTHNYETRTQFKPIVLPKNAPIQSHQGSHLSSQFKTKHTVEPQQLVRSQVSRFELPDQPSSQTSRQSTQSNSPATISKGEGYGLKSLRLLEEPVNQNPQIVRQGDISQGKVPQVDATIPRSPHLTDLTFTTVTPLPYPHINHKKPRKQSQQKPSLKKNKSKGSDIQAEPAPHFKNTPLHPKADPLYSFPSHKNKPRQGQRLSTIYEEAAKPLQVKEPDIKAVRQKAQDVQTNPSEKNIAAFTKEANQEFQKQKPSIKQRHNELEDITAEASALNTSNITGQEQAKNLFARTATTISQGLRSAVSVFTAKQASSLKTSSTSKKTNQEITDAEAQVTNDIDGAFDAQKTTIKKLETNAVTPQQAEEVNRAQNELSRTQKVWNKIKSIGVKPLIGAAAITTIVLILVDLLTGDIEE